MARLKELKYTLINHSGLPFAVELAAVNTTGQLQRVNDAGGVIFDTYSEASDAEEQYNYPPQVTGLHPNCTLVGRFSNKRIQGGAIFVPNTEEGAKP